MKWSADNFARWGALLASPGPISCRANAVRRALASSGSDSDLGKPERHWMRPHMLKQFANLDSACRRSTQIFPKI